jgi:apolipoprotein N-acyltransferase
MRFRRMPLVEIIFLVLLAAALNWLAQPNEIFLSGNWVFGLVNYLPLYLLFRRYLSDMRIAGWAGALYGVATTLSSYFWLSNFGEFSLWTLSGVSLAYVIFHRAFFRLMYHLLAPSAPMGDGITGGSQINPETPRVPADSPRALFAQNHGPIIFAVAWTAFEFFKSRGYLAFPWNLAAFPFHEILLFNQVADFGGVYLISFAVFLFQGAAGELIHDPNIPPRLSNPAWGYRFASVALILLFAVYGALRIADYSGAAFLVNDPGDDSPAAPADPSLERLRVLLVQQNVDSWAAADPNEGLRTAIDLSLEGILESSSRYSGTPDLIAWSETSLRYPYQPGNRYYDRNPSPISLRDFLAFSSMELITGAPIYKSIDPLIVYNGSIHIDERGRLLGEYGKVQLIPFAEHIPFSDFALLSRFLEEVIGLPPSGWTAGDETRLFTLGNGLSLGTPICFEDSFSKNTRYFVRSGADLLLNLTNNAWSKTNSAQMQHLVSARYRAIENRRILLRSTNGGVTSIIGPDGRILSQIPMFEEDYLLAEIAFRRDDTQTVFTRYGDWFAWLMTALLVGFLSVRYREI